MLYDAVLPNVQLATSHTTVVGALRLSSSTILLEVLVGFVVNTTYIPGGVFF